MCSPAEREWLAGDDLREVADPSRELVEHPPHHASVGVDVRRHHVAGRADEEPDGVHETPRQPLQLRCRQEMRVHLYAALRTSEGEIEQRRLPRHERGEAAHLVERDLRMEADPTLVGAARPVVLDAIPVVDRERPVVQGNPDLDDELLLRSGENVPQRGLEIEPLR